MGGGGGGGGGERRKMKRKEYTKPKYVIMRWRRLPTFLKSYRSLLCTSCQSNWDNGCRNLEVFIFVLWGGGGGGGMKNGTFWVLF